MEEREIRNLILLRLYDAWLRHETITSLHLVREETGWPETPFWSIAERMAYDGLISARTLGSYCSITPAGVLRCEDEGLPPAAVINATRALRAATLDVLANAYETEGSLAGVHVDEISRKIGADLAQLGDNILLLSHLDYIDTLTYDTYKITYKGMELVKERLARAAVAKRFEEIQSMEPHVRGKALETLVATLARQTGWSVKERVRTSSEEIDLVLHREREYFLVECKWEKDPVDAKAIRDLHGKLANRADSRGMFVSMSGFTRGAAAQAEDYASSRIVLLFGEKDVRALFRLEATLEQMLNERYEAMVTMKRAVFDHGPDP